MWDYDGFGPNITNASWGGYDTLYLNPFDSCCWRSEKDSWIPVISAIKKESPNSLVLATFHATEIWKDDLIAANRWLPEQCLMRNANGSTCSWWVGMVYTNNLFIPECFEAAVDNAVQALEPLIPAGVGGVFLDGVVNYDLGCTEVDVNCTTPSCSKTSQPPAAALEAEWTGLYALWFTKVKAKLAEAGDGLVWVNNLLDELQPELRPLSSGRMYEGTAAGGLNGAYVQARLACVHACGRVLCAYAFAGACVCCCFCLFSSSSFDAG
jgi:hypothetical protein